MRIVQLLPTLAFGDAVGNDALALLEILEQAGTDTCIYAGAVDSRIVRRNVEKICALPSLSAEDFLLYHMSTGWELAQGIRDLSCRKVMIYHNITPPQYFKAYENGFFNRAVVGRVELARLANVFDYALAVSEYNKQDLLAAGYRCPIDVLPIQIPFDDYRILPDAGVLEQYADGRTNLLFVGRVAPNKMIEDVIKTFYCYQKHYDPDARLFLVGGCRGLELYQTRLERYVERLGARNIVFTGHISLPEILSYYRLSDLFLCMSEHEGFCVPLVEAMFFDVPIVARAAAAVPETLGGAGVLVEGRDCLLAAGAVDKLMQSPALRRQVVAGQRSRLADFAYEKVRGRFLSCMRGFVAGAVAEIPQSLAQATPQNANVKE